jgi:hypothetical protein
VLGILAAVVNSRDVRRRDPVRRFTRQQRRGPAAGANWRPGSAAAVAVPPSMVTTFIHGPRAAPPACRTSWPPAPGATAPNAPGSRPPGSSRDWNNDAGSTSCPTLPSASANGSRSPS